MRLHEGVVDLLFVAGQFLMAQPRTAPCPPPLGRCTGGQGCSKVTALVADDALAGHPVHMVHVARLLALELGGVELALLLAVEAVHGVDRPGTLLATPSRSHRCCGLSSCQPPCAGPWTPRSISCWHRSPSQSSSG